MRQILQDLSSFTRNEQLRNNMSPSGRAGRGRSLDSSDFSGLNFHAQKHSVIAHEEAALQHLVGDEARKAEAERVGLLAGSLEVLPGRVRDKALHNVTGLQKEETCILDEEHKTEMIWKH